MNCVYCGEPVDISDVNGVLQAVKAYERKGVAASRRGGSDLILREHLPEFLHAHCAVLMQQGVAPTQTSLV